ncbi:MAG: ArsR/SmtB family transcription factor [Mangrovicoccus sp.]
MDVFGSETTPEHHSKTETPKIWSIVDRAEEASEYLKALSHSGRLMILCYLIEGEKTVTELERLLNARQSSVSQHLARLRADRLVKTRREGKAIHYSLSDDRTIDVINLLHHLFCEADRKA